MASKKFKKELPLSSMSDDQLISMYESDVLLSDKAERAKERKYIALVSIIAISVAAILLTVLLTVFHLAGKCSKCGRFCFYEDSELELCSSCVEEDMDDTFEQENISD